MEVLNNINMEAKQESSNVNALREELGLRENGPLENRRVYDDDVIKMDFILVGR